MAKKRKCRYTPEEAAMHETAVKLRKMTDEQLVNAFRMTKKAKNSDFQDAPTNDPSALKKFLDALSEGNCKGVGGATIYRLYEFAREMELIQ